MVVLPEVKLETVAVLCGIGAIGAAVLVNISVGLHMRVQHGLVDTGVITLVAFIWLGVEVVTKVVLQMMLVLCDK